MAAKSSSILVIGGTGYIGKHIVLAAARLGHPTFALVRSVAPADAAKDALLTSFSDAGVHLLQGDLNDHESLVKAVKMADVVISAVGHMQVAEQSKIVAAIKEAGNVKRFLPSEFYMAVDRIVALEPAKSGFAAKAQVRRHIEAEGIPYTFVVSNGFAGYGLPLFAFSGENVSILGDGNAKVIVVDEDDVGTYAVKAAVDPRAENKIVYIRPPANILTANEIYTMLEKKTNKSYHRSYVPDELIRKQIQGMSAVERDDFVPVTAAPTVVTVPATNTGPAVVIVPYVDCSGLHDADAPAAGQHAAAIPSDYASDCPIRVHDADAVDGADVHPSDADPDLHRPTNAGGDLRRRRTTTRTRSKAALRRRDDDGEPSAQRRRRASHGELQRWRRRRRATASSRCRRRGRRAPLLFPHLKTAEQLRLRAGAGVHGGANRHGSRR